MARTKATRRRRGPSYEHYRVRKITWVSGEGNYSVLWQGNTRTLESCSNIEGGAGGDRLDPLIWQYAKAHPNIEVFLNIERIRKNPDDPNLFSVCILHTVEGSAEDCPRSAIGYLGVEFLLMNLLLSSVSLLLTRNIFLIEELPFLLINVCCLRRSTGTSCELCFVVRKNI